MENFYNCDVNDENGYAMRFAIFFFILRNPRDPESIYFIFAISFSPIGKAQRIKIDRTMNEKKSH